MPIFYHGKTDDEQLLTIIEHYQGDAFFANLVEFCHLKRKGLRKSALAKLDSFIAECKKLSVIRQREIIKELNGLPTVIRTKSLNDYILDCVKKWLVQEPNNADLYCWLGKLTYDKTYFFKGLEIDETHLECARQVILSKLDFVDYQLHHVGESMFVYDAGDEKDGEQALQEAYDLIQKHPNLDNYIKQEYQDTKQLFDDWINFTQSKFDDFPKWCQTHNRHYNFIPAYYYTKD